MTTTEEQTGLKIPSLEQKTTRGELKTTSVELMPQGTTKIAQAEHMSTTEEHVDQLIQDGTVIENTEVNNSLCGRNSTGREFGDHLDGHLRAGQEFRDDLCGHVWIGLLGRGRTSNKLSGGSAKLEASLKLLGTAMVLSRATYMMSGNTSVASMMAEVSGVAFTTAGDSGVAAMTGRDCGMAARLG